MRSNSVLAKHPKYAQIISVYRDQYLANGGKVNEKKFWEEHIHPIVPGFSLQAFYQFMHRFRRETGTQTSLAVASAQTVPVTVAEKNLDAAMVSNDVATQTGIQAALNIMARTLKDIFADPEGSGMSKLQLADLGFKAMKAQDSRIKAIGAMRADDREEEKFNRMFKGNAM